MHGRWGLLFHLLAMAILAGTPLSSAAGQNCPVRTLLRVIDKNNQPVLDVTASQLKAEINGSPASISSLSAIKPSIILMLDASSSMKGSWNQSIASARQLVERAGENIVMFVFGEAIYAHAIGRSKSQDLLDQFSKQFPSGRRPTALYDTLIQVAGLVTTHDAVIVVISDGGDDMSLHSSDSTVSLFAHSSWPPVFGLILDYDQPDRHRLRGYFKKIPTATGGLAMYPSSASKVASAMDELTAIVLNSFTVTLQAPQPMGDTAKLKLELIGPLSKQENHPKLLHVAEIAGCNSQASSQH